jgi:hypothetical protein
MKKLSAMLAVICIFTTGVSMAAGKSSGVGMATALGLLGGVNAGMVQTHEDDGTQHNQSNGNGNVNAINTIDVSKPTAATYQGYQSNGNVSLGQTNGKNSVNAINYLKATGTVNALHWQDSKMKGLTLEQRGGSNNKQSVNYITDHN